MVAEIIPINAFMPNASNVVPFPSGTTPLEQNLARGVGRGLVALPGGVGGAPQAFSNARAGGVLGAVIVAAPIAAHYWREYLQDAIPVISDIPAPLLPAGNTSIAVTISARYFDTVFNAEFTDTRTVNISDVSSISRGVFIDYLPALGSGVYLGVNGSTGARIETVSSFTSFQRIRFTEILSAAIYPGGNVNGDPAPVNRPAPVPSISPGTFNPTVPITVPVAPVPGVVPYPIEIPFDIPNPWELPNHPIPLIPSYPEPGIEPFRVPPMWIHPSGLQIGSPPVQLTPPQRNGVPDTIPVIQQQLQRQSLGIGELMCCELPEINIGDCPTLDEMRTMIEEELDERIKKPPIFERKVQLLGTAQSRNRILPPLTRKCTLNIIQSPTNKRTQSGRQAQDVWYAGWYSFDYGERIPISYKEVTCYPPVESPGNWSYTLYDGFLATAVVYYDEEIEQSP